MNRRNLLLVAPLFIVTALAILAGGLGSASASPPTRQSQESALTIPHVGQSKWVVLLCQFADSPSDATDPVPSPHTVADYNDAFNTNPKGMKAYFKESSYNKLKFSAVVKDWRRLPHNRGFYGNYQSEGEAFLFELFDDCAARFNNVVDFSDFDGIAFMMDDRERDPNGGPCDFGESGCTDNRGLGVGGYGWVRVPKTLDGKFGFRAIWMPYLSEPLNEVTAHELSHAFGATHSAAGADDAGLHGECFPAGPPACGHEWDLMASASFGLPPDSHTLAATKVFNHRWITGTRRCNIVNDVSNRVIELERLARPRANDRCLAITIRHPQSSTAWYVVEARFPVGFEKDSSTMFPGGGVPGPSVLISRMCTGGTFCTREPMVIGRDENGDFVIDEASAEWQPGETFVSVGGFIRVEIVSRGAGFYTVRVTRDSTP
ncbi:MAG: hypothetical protein WEB00_01330 [Dehalococcoidia bacterium]